VWVEAGIVSLQGAYPLQGASDDSTLLQTTASPIVETTELDLNEHDARYREAYMDVLRYNLQELQSRSTVLEMPENDLKNDYRKNAVFNEVKRLFFPCTVTVDKPGYTLSDHLKKLHIEQTRSAFKGDRRDLQKYTHDSWYQIEKGPIWNHLSENGFTQEKATGDFWSNLHTKLEKAGFYDQMAHSDSEIIAHYGYAR
jgi:hypothetical protein